MTELSPLHQREDVLSALSHVEVLYTDLDGTLLARGGRVLADGSGQPSTTVAEAIVALTRADLRVVPVSGRTRLQLIELCRLLGWRDFIAEVGCVIARDIGTPQVTFEYDIGEWPADLLPPGVSPHDLIDRAGAFEALREAFPGQLEYHAPWHDHREGTHLLRGVLDLVEAQGVLDRLPVPVGILDNGLVHPPVHEITAEGPIHSYHLLPKGVSKAQAIAKDLSERGLLPHQAAAIGDSVADLEMARAVGTMVLVGNAFESPSVVAALETQEFGNVFGACCPRGDGWAEFAKAWLAARS